MTDYTYEIKDLGHGPALVVTPADADPAACDEYAAAHGYACRWAFPGLADDGASLVVPLEVVHASCSAKISLRRLIIRDLSGVPLRS